DPSQPRILNTEERLINLEEYKNKQQEKKTSGKTNSKSKEKEKVKDKDKDKSRGAKTNKKRKNTQVRPVGMKKSKKTQDVFSDEYQLDDESKILFPKFAKERNIQFSLHVVLPELKHPLSSELISEDGLEEEVHHLS